MAVAAIALCGPVFSVFSAFNTLLGFGACTAASMALGRGEYQRVRQFTSFCLYSSLLVGSLSMAAVWIAMKPMLSLLGADEVTAPYAAAYLRVFALSAPFMVSAGSLGNTLRADGDSKSALVGTMSGTVINILLDPLFISGLGWGALRGSLPAAPRPSRFLPPYSLSLAPQKAHLPFTHWCCVFLKRMLPSALSNRVTEYTLLGYLLQYRLRRASRLVSSVMAMPYS